MKHSVYFAKDIYNFYNKHPYSNRRMPSRYGVRTYIKSKRYVINIPTTRTKFTINTLYLCSVASGHIYVSFWWNIFHILAKRCSILVNAERIQIFPDPRCDTYPQKLSLLSYTNQANPANEHFRITVLDKVLFVYNILMDSKK